MATIVLAHSAKKFIDTHTHAHTICFRSCSIAIRHGLWIIYFLSKDKNLKYSIRVWGIPELVELITNGYPDFPTKKELILKIGTVVPGYVPSASLNQELITR